MTTPSQTVGPYLAIGLPWPDGADVVPPETPGRIRIHGRLFDGNGDPIPDGMIETWQADPDGRFGTGFRGFGRSATDAEGAFEIFTLKPGRVDERQAPHIDVNVFARGMLNRCVTRIYFADEANEGDPVLDSVPEERRGTIVAEPGEDGYRFDVHVQGERETVFFRV
jgi:protocatechuate 3,4-dioxygenase, alpha subunit